MNPFVDPTLTGLKEESYHFLKRIDLKIKENKEQFIFHRSETRFPSTTITSLTGLLDHMVIIHVRMVRESKGHQQFFKLCLIQTCEGTERTRMSFESLIGEHHYHLWSGVLDSSVVSRARLYHYSG